MMPALLTGCAPGQTFSAQKEGPDVRRLAHVCVDSETLSTVGNDLGDNGVSGVPMSAVVDGDSRAGAGEGFRDIGTDAS
jgi:hypothetical protein